MLGRGNSIRKDHGQLEPSESRGQKTCVAGAVMGAGSEKLAVTPGPGGR